MDLTSATWRKSTYSSNNGGNCVMVTDSLPGVVALQDSKNPGPALVIEPEAFRAFTAAIKAGEFGNLQTAHPAHYQAVAAARGGAAA